MGSNARTAISTAEPLNSDCPLVGIWGPYLQFSARTGSVQTMADRINGCMVRSMNGRPLPPEGPKLTTIEAYTNRLSVRPGGV